MSSHQLLEQILEHPAIRLRLTHRQTATGDKIAWCIFHDDGNGKAPHAPDLRVGPSGYYCHACKAKGSLRELAQHLGIDLDGDAREPVATWSYYAADGSGPCYQKCRFETPSGKSYALRRAAPGDWQQCVRRTECQRQRSDCRDGWIWSLKEKPCSPAIAPLLYNLPLLTSLPDAPVYVAEGEKCCDALGALDLVAVCNPYGAGEWRPEYSEALRGRQLVILPDADRPGRDHGRVAAESLRGKATSIKIADLYPDRTDGSDIADWIAERRAAGQSDDAIRAELEGLISQVAEWRPRPDRASTTLLPTIGSTVGSEVAGQDRLQGISLAALRRKAREVGTDVDALPLLGTLEPPVFQRGLSHIIAAPPKSGKTTLLYAQAKEWARAAISVLFISEEPEIVWSRRLQAEDADDEVLDRITLLPALGESPDALLERTSQGSEEIVILDTAKILGVEDENDAATVNRVITPWVVKARETGSTLIAAHHMRKGGGRAVEALAGSYSWAAVFDTVIEIELDEQESRRQLRAVGRLLPSCKLLYELRDSTLVLLGSPEAVELEATKERVLAGLTGEWTTTAQIHETLGDPKPSLEQARRALNSLAADGRVERHPPWSEGQKQGATYRWRSPSVPTSLPTDSPLVGSEVGGSDQEALPTAPAAGER
jgi:hypothetical protein